MVDVVVTGAVVDVVVVDVVVTGAVVDVVVVDVVVVDVVVVDVVVTGAVVDVVVTGAVVDVVVTGTVVVVEAIRPPCPSTGNPPPPQANRVQRPNQITSLPRLRPERPSLTTSWIPWLAASSHRSGRSSPYDPDVAAPLARHGRTSTLSFAAR